jgi:hypothetical protein
MLEVDNVFAGLTTNLALGKAKMQGLEKELAEAKKNLQTEGDELGILSAAIRVVCDDLNVIQSEGTSSLAVHVVQITDWARQLERNALHAGINRPFVIAHSYYGDTIDLKATSHGYAHGYEDKELEEMETAVAPLSQDLANRIENIVLPWRG